MSVLDISTLTIACLPEISFARSPCSLTTSQRFQRDFETNWFSIFKLVSFCLPAILLVIWRFYSHLGQFLADQTFLKFAEIFLSGILVKPLIVNLFLKKSNRQYKSLCAPVHWLAILFHESLKYRGRIHQPNRWNCGQTFKGQKIST